MLNRVFSIVAVVMSGIVGFNTPVHSQSNTAKAPTTASTDVAPLKQEELDQMLAPLALYPDSLLSQVLMACTYPLEIVQAERWQKANKSLKGEALTKALEGKDWDASVKSLVNFPDVLASLSEQLEWMTKIGDAMIADQKRVMDTIQALRGKAQQAGNLKSSEEMTVIAEPAPAGSTTTQVIKIESTDPQVIYVPTYDPVVVYGTWAYPSYPPPVYYRPPGYYAGAMVGFGVGVACGAAWGYAWGNCNWGGSDIDIDIDRNTNINNNINRDRYKNEFNNRTGNNRAGESRSGKGGFQHDSSHRRGVEYRDRASAEKYGGTSRADATRARESYRGRADTGRTDLSRDRASGRIDSSGRASGVSANRATGADRTSSDRWDTSRSSAARSSSNSRTADRATSNSRSSGLASSNSSGSSVRRDSSRGQSSRSSSRGSSRGGASRGGGRGGRR